MFTTSTKGEERPFKCDLQIKNVTLKAKKCPVLLRSVNFSSDEGDVAAVGGKGGCREAKKGDGMVKLYSGGEHTMYA